MQSDRARFGQFILDAADRQLSADGERIDLNARYFDALALMVREPGRLISKDRFLDEVWNGVPVTDEALTQCIRSLRRVLGDDAARPRFIETVPKHGYRFIAEVEPDNRTKGDPAPPRANGDWQRVVLLGLGGMIGGGMAGLAGGLIYGFAGASQPQPGAGAVSVLLVLICLCILVALIGGLGVALGISAAGFARGRSPWPVAGGAAGGLVVGAITKLLGLDAFNLLFGRAPGDITGAAEGAAIGAAAGLGAWLARDGGGRLSLRRGIAAAGLAGAGAGLIVTSLGGRLMAGSLDLLAREFPSSRLRVEPIGALFGEQGLGPVSRAVTGALEGGLFAGCVVASMILAQRSLAAGGQWAASPRFTPDLAS